MIQYFCILETILPVSINWMGVFYWNDKTTIFTHGDITWCYDGNNIGMIVWPSVQVSTVWWTFVG